MNKQQRFSSGHVVWAKTRGYSWWPAIVQKYLSRSNEYSIIFLGKTPVIAKVGDEFVKDYEEYFHEFSSKKTAGLKKAIEEATKQLKDRKYESKTAFESHKPNNSSFGLNFVVNELTTKKGIYT